MEALLGTGIAVFIAVTVCLMGFCAFMTGQALAASWRPVWQVLVYALLLGVADRFLTWALFQGELLLVSGYVIDTLYLLAVGLLAYRVTMVRRITAQYPWLYERAGPFGWRKKGGI
jgi:hypothetical protein